MIQRATSHIHSPLVTHLRKFALSLLATLIASQFFVSVAGAQVPPLGRPILFVHGWCADGTEWEPVRDYVISGLVNNYPSLYPSTQQVPQVNYYAYYDVFADAVSFLNNDGSQVTAPIPPTNRFFTIKFYDPVFHDLDTTNVTHISILNKAYELSQVIKAITNLTTIKDVIVVTHSMGGLVARAYVENLGSQYACYHYGTDDTRDPSSPDYTNGLCGPGYPELHMPMTLPTLSLWTHRTEELHTRLCTTLFHHALWVTE